MGIWVALISVYYLKTTRASFTLFLAIALSFIGLTLISHPPAIFDETDAEILTLNR
jgi:hypothetical protein